MFWQICGLIIIVLLLVQLFLFTLAQFNRTAHSKKVSALEHQNLQGKIQHLQQLRQKKTELGIAWNGIRKFVVKEKIQHTDQLCSFYLSPHVKKALPDFRPGQYLTFELHLPGESKPLIRCYSLSDSPNPNLFRVTIKKVPQGKASNYFHDTVQDGDILDVKAPSGKFFLETNEKSGIVLIGGGIGLTPVLSMLNFLVDRGSPQEIYFFYGVRNRAEHIMKEHLEKIAQQFPNVHLHVCYSLPNKNSQKERDYHHQCRVSTKLLKEVLPSNNFDYYFCGPGAMMESLADGLSTWGVPSKNIHFETFGPASVQKTSKKRPPVSIDPSKQVAHYNITFKRSGKQIPWDYTHQTLLELAEANAISIPSGCRAGSCGTCLTALQSGAVEYHNEPGSDPDPGTCLTCIAIPKSDIVIDA